MQSEKCPERRILGMLLIIVLLVLASCAQTHNDLPEDFESDVRIQLFLETWNGGYAAHGYDWSISGITSSEHAVERGFTYAVSTTRFDYLAKELGYRDSSHMREEVGQLFEHKVYEQGEFFLFSGYFTGNNRYTFYVIHQGRIHQMSTHDHPESFVYNFSVDGDSLYLMLEANIDVDYLPQALMIYEFDYLNETCTNVYKLEAGQTPISNMLLGHVDSAVKSGVFYGLYLEDITETTAESTVYSYDLATGTAEFYRVDRCGISLDFADDLLVAVFGEMSHGNSGFPIHVLYLDDKLNAVDERIIAFPEENYSVKYCCPDSGYLYMICNAMDGSDKKIIIADTLSGRVLYSETYVPPLKNANLLSVSFYKRHGDSYYDLR